MCVKTKNIHRLVGMLVVYNCSPLVKVTINFAINQHQILSITLASINDVLMPMTHPSESYVELDMSTLLLKLNAPALLPQEHSSKLPQLLFSEGLCDVVGNLLIRAYVPKINVAAQDPLFDEVVMHLNVLCVCMEH